MRLAYAFTYTLTPLHPYTLSPLHHPYTRTPSHSYSPTPPHPHTLTPFNPYTFAPVHPYICTPLHPYTLTPRAGFIYLVFTHEVWVLDTKPRLDIQTRPLAPLAGAASRLVIVNGFFFDLSSRCLRPTSHFDVLSSIYKVDKLFFAANILAKSTIRFP